MQKKDPVQVAIEGSLLGNDGDELKKGLWESCVYLGRDGYVYQIVAEQTRGGLRSRVSSKRPVGDYLRWVDGLFRHGELPDESNGVHYRAARLLRELI